MGELSVLIDGRHLSGFGARRGFGRYLRSLLPLLAEAPSVSISVLATEAGRPAIPPGVRIRSIRRSWPGTYADFEHRARLSLDVARARADIFHSSASDPPFWCSQAWLQTLHDVPLTFAGADQAGELRAWTRRRRKVKKADAVIAVSQYVAERAVSILGVDPGRIHVVPHGVASAFSAGPEHPEGRPGGRDPYLLLVSEYGHHKGYGEAFGVISRLARRGLGHRLLVAGTVAPWWRPDIDRLLRGCSHPERVAFADYVDDQALAELYRGADALVVTSRCEGFGLPALEAMACGTPVIAFDNSALPEVVGDGGLLVPDGDVGAMAEAVAGVFGDDSSWREASIAAQCRASKFSWTASARSHLAVYAQVGGIPVLPSEVNDPVAASAREAPGAVGRL